MVESEQKRLAAYSPPSSGWKKLAWAAMAVGGVFLAVSQIPKSPSNSNAAVVKPSAARRSAAAQAAPPPAVVVGNAFNPPAFPPTFEPTAAAPVPEKITAVPDDGGPIAELVLQYAASSEKELGPVVRDLFTYLAGDLRITVVCPNEESVDAFITRWGAAAIHSGRDIRVVNVNRPISVWARDRRIARQDSSGQAAASFVPVGHGTYDDEKQNDLLLSTQMFSVGLTPRIALSAFHLEGGNLVSNGRHLFTGLNLLQDNTSRFADADMAAEELYRVFGKQAVLVHDRHGGVPWCHTDMYITPVDEQTVLVASPADGIEVLGGVDHIGGSPEDPTSGLKFNLATRGTALQEQFDDVAEQIASLGYRVVRMPALINTEEDWMVTYNNVLMERRNGRRRVHMPVYRIPEIDDAAARVWRDLGFDVFPVDVSTVFRLGGAVRCLANVTLRHPTEHVAPLHERGVRGSLKTYQLDGDGSNPEAPPSLPQSNPPDEPRPGLSRFQPRPNEDVQPFPRRPVELSPADLRPDMPRGGSVRPGRSRPRDLQPGQGERFQRQQRPAPRPDPIGSGRTSPAPRSLDDQFGDESINLDLLRNSGSNPFDN